MDHTITIPGDADRAAAFGPGERSLKMLREALGVSITARGGRVRVQGDRAHVRAATRVIEEMLDASTRGRVLSRRQVLDAVADAASDAERGGLDGPGSFAPAHAAFGDERGERRGRDHDSGGGGYRGTGGERGERGAPGRLDVYAGGRPIAPRSDNQQYYLDTVFDNDLTFAVGPAGTGKTYLAVAAAVHQLKAGRVKRVILARPAVEAGEKLGFLPGDQFAKVNPYLRPLLDALNDMLDYATIKQFMSSDVVEVVPLGFMRGRTLNDAAIILDEAQNTTRGQMQMFLTRMGQRSTMIVTGDVTQIDLPDPAESGLIDAVHRLKRVPGVGFVVLEKRDVVRHELVQRVIDAYAAEREETETTREALEHLEELAEARQRREAQAMKAEAAEARLERMNRDAAVSASAGASVSADDDDADGREADDG